MAAGVCSRKTQGPLPSRRSHVAAAYLQTQPAMSRYLVLMLCCLAPFPSQGTSWWTSSRCARVCLGLSSPVRTDVHRMHGVCWRRGAVPLRLPSHTHRQLALASGCQPGVCLAVPCTLGLSHAMIHSLLKTATVYSLHATCPPPPPPSHLHPTGHQPAPVRAAGAAARLRLSRVRSGGRQPVHIHVAGRAAGMGARGRSGGNGRGGWGRRRWGRCWDGGGGRGGGGGGGAGRWRGPARGGGRRNGVAGAAAEPQVRSWWPGAVWGRGP